MPRLLCDRGTDVSGPANAWAPTTWSAPGVSWLAKRTVVSSHNKAGSEWLRLRDWLEAAYVDRSAEAIARDVGVGATAVRRAMRKLGVEVDTNRSR